jgi:nitric oxide reductase large subunit
MSVGLVSRKLAERATYFEIILIFLGGVIGHDPAHRDREVLHAH